MHTVQKRRNPHTPCIHTSPAGRSVAGIRAPIERRNMSLSEEETTSADVRRQEFIPKTGQREANLCPFPLLAPLRRTPPPLLPFSPYPITRFVSLLSQPSHPAMARKTRSDQSRPGPSSNRTCSRPPLPHHCCWRNPYYTHIAACSPPPFPHTLCFLNCDTHACEVQTLSVAVERDIWARSSDS